MKKYRHVLNIGIQNSLTYRFNFLARSLFGLIPLMAMLYVWRTIYRGNAATHGSDMVGTYTFAEMVSYYLLTTIVDALTALLQFFMSYTMAMLAFWVLEVSTFIFILFAFEYLASGHLFPLDILPPWLERALYFTPFPYQLYFPISIYMSKTTGAELAR